jgi:hypothetical protein
MTYADIFHNSRSTRSTINFSEPFKLFDKRHLGHGKEGVTLISLIFLFTNFNGNRIKLTISVTFNKLLFYCFMLKPKYVIILSSKGLI